MDGNKFIDTAAILQSMDLVITSDTALAHLAGALGVRTWVALPIGPDWRWHLGSNRSPWYPSVTLFRQDRFEDWSGVFQEMAKALGDESQPVKKVGSHFEEDYGPERRTADKDNEKHKAENKFLSSHCAKGFPTSVICLN